MATGGAGQAWDQRRMRLLWCAIGGGVAVVTGGKLASLDVRLQQADALAKLGITVPPPGSGWGQGGGGDEASFQMVLRTLNLYRERHGNLRVPEGFIVPKEEPWPKERVRAAKEALKADNFTAACAKLRAIYGQSLPAAPNSGGKGNGKRKHPSLGEPGEQGAWGWRLARRVYSMTFWQSFVAGNAKRRDALEKLGFVWGRLQPNYNLLLEALVIYKSLHGSLHVPRNFIVPDEEPWPQSLHVPRDCIVSDEKPLPQSVRGRSLDGSLHVPRNFIVPDEEPWLQSVRDMRLGRVVTRVRGMGFIFDPFQESFERVRVGLEHYRNITGRMGPVPVRFQVPHEPPWPTALWGFQLGRRLHAVRAEHRYIRTNPLRIRQLNDAAFQWQSRAEAAFARLVRGIKVRDAGAKHRTSDGKCNSFMFARRVRGVKAYKVIMESVTIPVAFTVPPEDPWPQELWGFRLGTALRDVRVKGYYLNKPATRVQRIAQLQALGVWPVTALNPAAVDAAAADSAAGSGRGSSAAAAAAIGAAGAAASSGGAAANSAIGTGALQLRERQHAAGAASPQEQQRHARRVSSAMLRQQSSAGGGSGAAAAVLQQRGASGAAAVATAALEHRSCCDGDACAGVGSRERAMHALLVALRAYRAAHGAAGPPVSFVVPAAEPWPREAWGVKLGARLRDIRRGRVRADRYGAAVTAELETHLGAPLPAQGKER
ncbi:hypothetical protein JKP88DRAFT_353591 [Tribonema minus]|uniref:Uncharacterized protein n=1 Tax=Tribonema minus TaxID=303371 RepID=A0A836CLI8_9STRA|nr:hypothetical protein JKP88DRAFT_353591 [Tribonema minus]